MKKIHKLVNQLIKMIDKSVKSYTRQSGNNNNRLLNQSIHEGRVQVISQV